MLYDENYYELVRMLGSDFLCRQILTSAAVFCGDKVILDMGCGRGEMAALCLREGAAKVVAFDISPVAIKHTQELLRREGALPDKYRLICDSTDNMENHFPAPVFDYILMVDVVEHISPDCLKAALRSCRKVLKPDGLLLIHTFPNLHSHRLFMALLSVFRPGLKESIERVHCNVQTRRSLEGELSSAGFSNRRTWVRNEFIYASSFFQNYIKNRGMKSLLKLLFYDILNSAITRKIIGRFRLEELFYWSIYATAGK